jgi:EAL domain-containing protein (putative c-di-GMP-specific phosphodiesterase class I)
MTVEATERVAMESALRRAVIHSEFELYYQPQYDLTTDRICGAEVLLRWHSQQWGDVSPVKFIPVLEDTGMIVEVGEWVLRQACMTFMALRETLPSDFRVAVNISGRQFKGGKLPLLIQNIMSETGIPAANLELEITESLLLEDTALATLMLNEIADLGIKLAIDDFGTGYSSLSYLKQFPLNVLKIDRSFIRDLHNDEGDAAIVDAILALSTSLGLEVVAEGVETVAQLDYLKQLACHRAQGYLLSVPVDRVTFEGLINA